MKIKFNTNLVINSIVIGFILLIALNWSSFYFMQSKVVWVPTPHNVYNSWSNSQLKPFDTLVDENLPHKQYIKLTDSIKNMRRLKNGTSFIGSGSQFLVLGATWAYQCDTCTAPPLDFTNTTANRLYYLQLTHWKLIQDRTVNPYTDADANFHVENGKPYLRKIVTDTSINQKDGSIYNKKHFADVPVKFWYWDKRNGEGSLLIPIGKTTHNVFNIVLPVLGIAFALYIFYLLSVFLKLIADLSKGLVFTDKNIGRLKLIGLSLLIFPVAFILVNYSLKLIFYSYFTADVESNIQIWPHLYVTIGLGIVFLLLFKAFRQGKILKDEQDLTV